MATSNPQVTRLHRDRSELGLRSDLHLQNLLTGADRIAKNQALRPLPTGNVTAEIPGVVQRETETVVLLVSEETIVRERLIQLLLMNIKVLKDAQLLGAYLSIFGNLFTNYGSIAFEDLTSNSYTTYCVPIPSDPSEAELLTLFSDSYHVNAIDTTELTKQEQDVAICVLSLLISKDLTSLNHIEWTNRRLTAFKAETGIRNCRWGTNQMPEQPECSSLHAKLCQGSTRRNLFLKFRDLATTRRGLGQLIYTAIHLMRWTNMTHFALIDEYIVKQNPILLAWEPLHKRIHHLIQAYELVAKFPEEDVPFIRILASHDQALPLHRQNLAVFTAVAMKFAVLDQPTLESYAGNTTIANYQKIANAAYNLVQAPVIQANYERKAMISRIVGDKVDDVMTHLSKALQNPDVNEEMVVESLEEERGTS